MIFPARIIAIVTAAFVSLNAAVCACGGMSRTADHGAEAVAADAAPMPMACHGEPSKSQDGHHHDGGACQHCQPAVTADAGSPAAHAALLTLHPSAFAALPPLFAVAVDSAAPDRAAFAGDLPPPAPPTSLLRLHCALVL